MNCKSRSIEAEIDRLWSEYFAAIAPVNEAECVEIHNRYMAGGWHTHDIWEKYHAIREPMFDAVLSKISALSARAEFKVI